MRASVAPLFLSARGCNEPVDAAIARTRTRFAQAKTHAHGVAERRGAGSEARGKAELSQGVDRD